MLSGAKHLKLRSAKLRLFAPLRVTKSAGSAESVFEMMWKKTNDLRIAPEPAENPGNLRTFCGIRLTGSKVEDCYTFEGFAASPAVIHTAYYYHYKRTTLGLKEETKWS